MAIVPLHTVSYPYPVTLPYQQVSICYRAPEVTFLIPNRFWNDNYYDTSVNKVILPFGVLNYANQPKQLLPVSDRITLATALPTIPETEIALIRNGALIDCYRKNDAYWIPIAMGMPLETTTLLEERQLPSCLQMGTGIFWDVAIDSRANQQVLTGQVLQLGPKQYRVPLVGLSATQYGTLDLSALPLPAIERIFITDNYEQGMFPSHINGHYLAIHIVYSGAPMAVVHYGANYAQVTELLPLTDLAAVAGTVVEGEAYALAPLTLSVAGALVESSQSQVVSQTYTPTLAQGSVRVKWSFTMTTPPEDAYLSISLGVAPTSPHPDFPLVLTNPQCVHVVLPLKTLVPLVHQGLYALALSTLNAAPSSNAGDWEIVITPNDQSAYLGIYHNQALLAQTSLTGVSIWTLYQPLTLQWGLNAAESMSVIVTPQSVKNPVPLDRAYDLCLAENPLTLSPCLSTDELLAIIPYRARIDFENDLLGDLAHGDLLATNNTGTKAEMRTEGNPASIIMPAIISGSNRALDLASGAKLFISHTTTPLVNQYSLRVFISLESLVYGNILELHTIDTGYKEHKVAIMLNQNPAGFFWSLMCSTKDQVNGLWVHNRYDTNIPVIEGALYALSLSIKRTQIDVYINGQQSSFSWGAMVNRMFYNDVRENQCELTLGGVNAIKWDDIIVAPGVYWDLPQSVALANDPLTRGDFNCGQVNLTTPLIMNQAQAPVNAALGGRIKQTDVKRLYITTTRLGLIYQLPPAVTMGLVDVILSSKTATDVLLCYGNYEAALYGKYTVTGQVIIRGVRVDQNLSLYLKTSAPISIRIVALLM